MSLLPVGIGNAGGEYTIDNSLRIRQSAGAYLTRSQSSGNQTTWTWSAWVKLAYLNNDQWLFGGYYNTSNFTGITINLNTGIQLYQKNGGSTTFLVREAPIRRDYSSWYHFVIAYDSTESTSTDRIRFYTNGEQITTYASTTWPDASRNSFLNYNAATANIGRGLTTGNAQFDGYQTEINYVDGQALTADDFGEFDETTGVWKPKEYTGTYGTNGFYLPTTATTQAEGFNTVLYTGKAADQSISGVGFTPDLVWTKSRSNAYHPNIYDSVRGAQLALQSSSTTAELTGYPKSLYSFDTDGFTLGNQDNSNYTSGSNAVAWCWDAGANQATTGISSVTFEASGSAGSVSGFGFSPDLIIAKNRTNGYSWEWWDSIRGVNSTLFSNSTNAEDTTANRIVSFDSDGFSYGTSSNIYVSSTKSVAYGFDAGDGDPVSNTQGDVTTTVKANDATGFSIVSYTGNGSNSTIGHGLSTAPSVFIIKNRDTAVNDWIVYQSDVGATKFLRLNKTNATTTQTNIFNDTEPTSSVFTVGTNSAVNSSGVNYIAYCFSEVSGVSSFGTYTGTGTTSGPTITTGFRPGFVLVKSTTNGALSWHLYDGTRNPFNAVDLRLSTNSSAAEDAVVTLGNFTDTGFEITSSATQVNQLNGEYIYMAFKGSYSDYVSPLNTSGSIDSRVKANTEKGFSIVSYEGNATAGATVGHGLTSAPEMVIVKARDQVRSWVTYHASVGNTGFLQLQSTSAALYTPSMWNNTSPTSSVFSLGSDPETNGNTYKFIAYCFHSVAGYSDFGTYTGTGSSGNSVTTGFRPAFLMIKATDASSTGWIMVDNTRDPDNLASEYIYADSSAAEATYTNILEFTDTGFELIIGAGSAVNSSGVNYIYMAFADTRDAQFNFDASGNKNNWTANNINSNASSEPSYDIMTDVPTLTDEYTANYCTFNPLSRFNSGGSVVLSNGNLKAAFTNIHGNHGTISVSGGKYYWEAVLTSSGINSTGGGIVTIGQASSNTSPYYGWILDVQAGRNYYNNSYTTLTGGAFASGDRLGVALDMDNGKIWYAKNGTWLGTSADPATGTGAAQTNVSGEVVPIFYEGNSGFSATWEANFGQRPFAYTPPTGFLPLNTYNLPDSTIEDGSEYMNTVTFSGTGATGNAITGLGFQPDMVWAKSRSVAANHELADIVRGTPEVLFPNLTNAEITDSTRFESFDSDGFTLGANANANGSGYSSVGWAWKANGSGVSNTVGVTPSTVSANTTSGFSIVSYTGTGANTTVGHGLGLAPDMMIVKDRDGSNNWIVYARSQGAVNRATLNTTNAWSASATSFNSTDPTSTVFSLGSSAGTNTSGREYINYVFAAVEGFSAFGKYTGNGSSDGPFIYTGFRPAWIMVKRTNSADNWWIQDNARDPYNVAKHYLSANTTNAEFSNLDVYDYTANGFKIRTTTTAVNASGSTYIYAAFAENPFKNSLAR